MNKVFDVSPLRWITLHFLAKNMECLAFFLHNVVFNFEIASKKLSALKRVFDVEFDCLDIQTASCGLDYLNGEVVPSVHVRLTLFTFKVKLTKAEYLLLVEFNHLNLLTSISIAKFEYSVEVIHVFFFGVIGLHKIHWNICLQRDLEHVF